MSDESTQKAVSEETKEKFRKALERKKEQGESRIPAAGGESAIHGVHGKAGNKRQFRRKSS
jgi:hypothetical protein